MTAAREQHRFQQETWTPARLPPPGSCDTQFHAYGDPARYPLHPKRPHDPQLDATFEAAVRMHRALGIERGVYVQPTAYQTDHRFLIDALRAHPSYRASCLLDETVSDAELATLHEVGVRAVRVNFKQGAATTPTPEQFRRIVARAGELGWHVKVRTEREDLLAYEELLRSVEIPILIDHMGHLDYARGADQPAFRLIRDLLEHTDNWWVMLGNCDRYSDAPWDEAATIAQAFIAAAPDRVVWATDWPHNQYYTKPIPNDADLLEYQLYRWAPDDATLRRILVDNPARLYDFPR